MALTDTLDLHQDVSNRLPGTVTSDRTWCLRNHMLNRYTVDSGTTSKHVRICVYTHTYKWAFRNTPAPDTSKIHNILTGNFGNGNWIHVRIGREHSMLIILDFPITEV